MILSVVTAGAVQAQAISADDFLPFDPVQARIGQLLFYDKILSGNRNISCGTCHHHTLGGTDGLSLGIGEGGSGLGPLRTATDGANRISKRIPRNAPALWNLGHRDVSTLFHDGRVARGDAPGTFQTPAGALLPQTLNSVLAAQALFPMTSEAEMAGDPHENGVARSFGTRLDYGWDHVADRVRSIPEYNALFQTAFPHVSTPDQITIAEIGNALAAFIGTEWQSYDSPYDAWLTQGIPLPEDAERGRELFFGKAGCSACHSGPLFSDQGFHAMGMPAFGPGRTRAFDPIPRDVGRVAVTDDASDAYKFRTLPLRNIALTAPYGHNGAYPTLQGIIRHMATPRAALAGWTPDDAHLPKVPWLDDYDFIIREDQMEMDRQLAAIEVDDVPLSDAEVADIEAFLHALTGASAEALSLGRPDRVPSGLPVD